MGVDAFADSDSIAIAASICAGAAQAVADYPGAGEELAPPTDSSSGAIAASEAVSLAHRQAYAASNVAAQLCALLDGLSGTFFAAAARFDDAEFYAGGQVR